MFLEVSMENPRDPWCAGLYLPSILLSGTPAKSDNNLREVYWAAFWLKVLPGNFPEV